MLHKQVSPYKELHVYNLQRVELRFLKLHDRHAFAILTILVRELGEEVVALINVRRLIGCSIHVFCSLSLVLRWSPIVVFSLDLVRVRKPCRVTDVQLGNHAGKIRA